MWESVWFWLLLGATVVVGLLTSVAVLAWPRLRARQNHQEFTEARRRFHQRREWLEARFLSLAGQSGKPRGLKWLDCDFEDQVAFARERRTGRLRALVGVTIQFEAIPGGGMEEVSAVADRKAATVVFRLDGPEWDVDDRPLFNLNPAQTIQHYQHELEVVDQT